MQNDNEIVLELAKVFPKQESNNFSFFDSDSPPPRYFNHYKSQLSYHKSKELSSIPHVIFKLPFLVISPFSFFKKIWILLISIALIYTAWVFPFRLAFEPDFSTETLLKWVYMDFALDVLFMLDIGVNALSAYEDDDGNLIYRKFDIFWNYMKFWFWIDLLSCFPFSLLSSDNLFSISNQFTKISKLPKLFRLLRLLKLVRMKSFSYNKTIKNLFEKKKTLFELSKQCYYFFFLIHVSSCMIYYSIQYEPIEEMDQNWVVFYGLIDQSITQKYIAALYFVMTIMVTTGYGNITATTNNEKIMVIFMMFVGIFFYGRLMGTLIELSLYLKHEIREFLDKVEFLNALSMKFNLPTRFHVRILFNYRKSNYCEKTNYFQKFINEGFFNAVDETILSEVCLFVFKKELEKFEFFENKPSFFSSKILISMKAVFYARGELIFNKGDPPEFLYFILEGKVETYFINKEGIKMSSMFLEGGYFGEIESIFKARRQETAFAHVDTMLWRVDSGIFMRLLEDYPEINKEILIAAGIKQNQRNILYENVVSFPALVPMNYWRWKHEYNKNKLDLERILYKQKDCYNQESRKYGRKYYSDHYKVVLKDVQARQFIDEKRNKIRNKYEMVEVEQKDIDKEAYNKLEESIFGNRIDGRKENLHHFQTVRRECENLKQKNRNLKQVFERVRVVGEEMEKMLESLRKLKKSDFG